MNFTLYDLATGEIKSTGTIPRKEWLLVPDGQGVLWDFYSPENHVVVIGKTIRARTKTKKEIDAETAKISKKRNAQIEAAKAMNLQTI